MNSKIVAIFALIIGLIVAVSLAVQVGQGEFKTVYIITVLTFSVPIIMLLGVRSWYTLPFAMLAELPAVPLIAGRAVSMAEMCIAMFSGIMILTIVQGRIRFRFKIKDWWPMLLYGGWVLMIAMLNGGGFAILGSAAMGGRRYLTVVIALVGMVALSQMVIRDKEAKRVCWLIAASLALSGIYIASVAMFERVGAQSAYAFYSWQQGLSLISLGGVLLLFARVAPSNVIKTPLYIITYLILLGVVAYSGKRMAFASCCIIPVVACFWHRQAVVAVFAVMFGSVAIAGSVMTQNYVASIPKPLQRVLAFLPAEWDWEVEQSTVDTFRETLNRWAVIAVKENPVIGKGVTLTTNDYLLMSDDVYISQIKLPDDDVLAFPHIAGKNWHSTWLGLAASFGIPCAIFWLLLQFYVLRNSWRLGHNPQLGEWCRVLMGMVFFFMVYGILRSLSSGDVASLAMGGGLYLGLMSAIRNGLEQAEIVDNHQPVSHFNHAVEGVAS